MKKTTLLSTIAGALMMVPAVTNAQYIAETPAGGVNLDGLKDVVVLYAPQDVVTKLGDRVISNQNLDPSMEKNQFYYWTHDWAKNELQLCSVVEEGGKNSWGGSDYLNMTPRDDWGGGGFAAKSQPYDLSKVDNDHIIHIGLRDFGQDDGKAKFKFQFGPLNKIKTNGFSLIVNVAAGKESGDYVGVGNMGHDGKWYSFDIPVKELIDEDGDFAFAYDFSQPINDHVFTVTFSDATASVTKVLTTGDAKAGTVDTYEITKLGTALSIDAIYFYKKDAASVKTVETATGAAAEAVYDLQGRRTEMNRPGLYVVRSAAGTRKVLVK